MAEQLLDDAQVRAALEQVGGERVAQRVRRDAVRQAGRARTAGRAGSAGRGRRADRRGGSGRSRPAASRRVTGRARELERAPAGRPRGRRRAPPCRPAEQPDALLAALADDPDLAAAQVQRAEVGCGELADPQARGVGRLDERPVAQREGGRERRPRPVAAGRGGELLVDDREERARPGRPRGPAAGGAAGAAWRSRPTGRRPPARRARVAIERADRGEPLGDRAARAASPSSAR